MNFENQLRSAGGAINQDLSLGGGGNGSADAGVAARKKAAAEAVRAMSGGPRKQPPADTPQRRAFVALKTAISGRAPADAWADYDPGTTLNQENIK